MNARAAGDKFMLMTTEADTATQAPAFSGPIDPRSLVEAGLNEATIETLVLKILYFRGELYGRDLSRAIGLRFSVIEGVVDALKLRHHLQIKRSLGVGNIGSVLALTDAGRERAREALDANQYAGAAPVPLDQYVAMVREQRPKQGWLTRDALESAFKDMVITERLLSQVGPAISSAKSLLLYGKPGDGKTFLIESLNNLDTAPVFVPYAIECQGNIIQVFDPVYHQPIAEEETESVLLESVRSDAPYDRRWVKCRRPFIVSGGELTLDMLDLRFNVTSKIYEAPLQLKANNGIYLIDDFGRQRAAPAEVLNRWIVPMERQADYLSFMTGGKMTVPFETFLVFSTNLNPADLGDEAFLRRIQYKLLLRGPSKDEFDTIFENFCAAKGIPYRRETVQRFVERHYTGKKEFRRCHPRDVLTHALNLIHFERLPMELTDNLMSRAFESCFLQEEAQAPASEIAIVPPSVKTCHGYWVGQLAGAATVFGRLVRLSGLQASGVEGYPDTGAREFLAAEHGETLTALHLATMQEWLALGKENQSRDLAEYLSTPERKAIFRNLNTREFAESLMPAEARQAERIVFRTDLANAAAMLRDEQDSASVVHAEVLGMTA